MVERKRAEPGDVGVIHEVLLPALLLVSQHRAQNEITEEDAMFMLDVINEIVQQMAPSDAGQPVAPVIGLAARTPEDQTALELLRAAVGREAMTLVPLDLSADEAVNERDRAATRRGVHRRDLADARCGGAQLLPSPAQRIAGDEDHRAAAAGASKWTSSDLRRACRKQAPTSSWSNAKEAVEAIERLLPDAPATRATLNSVGQV